MKHGRFERKSAWGHGAWPAILALSAVLAAGVQLHDALAATLASQEQAANVVSIRNVTVKDGVVSGELVNKFSRPLRDVQLLIRYTWLWKNEMHPDQDEVSDAVYYTVEGEIPAGGSKPFTSRPSAPLPARADGHFDVAVSIAGFTEIIPPK